ncbi:hypothetical protein DWZ67_16590, partial [Bacteroides sp. AF34-31BH]|uniref:BACON domain-containing protein n=1 Tax=Bacteroides sp. AF34-31BH TaxID=2292931 RepID=UPI000EC7488F
VVHVSNATRVPFQVLATANEGYDERSAEITFIDGESGLAETVKVIQKQLDAIFIGQDEYTLGCEGGTIEIKVDANVEYTVTTSENWIEQITTRALSTGILRFTILANDSESQRTGSVTLTGGDITKIIVIRQAGKDNTSGGIDDMPTQPW